MLLDCSRDELERILSFVSFHHLLHNAVLVCHDFRNAVRHAVRRRQCRVGYVPDGEVPLRLLIRGEAEAVEALGAAAYCGDAEKMRLELSKEVPYELCARGSDYGRSLTPLSISCFEGHAECTALLLSFGSSADITNLVHAAARGTHHGLLNIVLENLSSDKRVLAVLAEPSNLALLLDLAVDPEPTNRGRCTEGVDPCITRVIIAMLECDIIQSHRLGAMDRAALRDYAVSELERAQADDFGDITESKAVLRLLGEVDTLDAFRDIEPHKLHSSSRKKALGDTSRKYYQMLFPFGDTGFASRKRVYW